MVGREKKYYAILLFVVLYIGAGFLFAVARDINNDYYEVFRSKMSHADKTKSARRILLVGGSNMLWGYRSQTIEENLKIPTTNLALKREADNPEVMRELVISVVQKNDIVVYSSILFWNEINFDFEASQALLKSAGLNINDDSSWLDFTSMFGSYWSFAPTNQPLIFNLPKIFHRYILGEPTEYFSSYNEFGDIKSCTSKIDVKPRSFTENGDIEALTKSLLKFKRSLEEKGAKLVLEFSSLLIDESDRERWINEYQPLFFTLKDNFILSTTSLDEVLFSDTSLFCDTHNHLVDEAALRRSEHMASFLKEYIKTLRKKR